MRAYCRKSFKTHQDTRNWCFNVIFYFIILQCCCKIEISESKSIKRLNLLKFSSSNSIQTKQETSVNFSSHRIVRRSAARKQCNRKTTLTYTARTCGQIEDIQLGLQWSATSRSSFFSVKAINDNIRHNWIIWARDGVYMFGLESRRFPGKYHFAHFHPRRSTISLTVPQEEKEINPSLKDSRYFRIYQSIQSGFNVIQHINSGFFIAINRTYRNYNGFDVTLAKESNSLHHWVLLL